MDWQKLREDSRPDAEKEVRASLLLSKIAEAEEMEVSEEEVDEVIREMAQEAHEPPATLKTRLTRDGEAGYTEVYSPKSKSTGFHLPQRENHSEK